VIILFLCTESEQMEECDFPFVCTECEYLEGCDNTIFVY